MTTATGIDGTVEFDGKFITITRSGFLANAAGGKGEKRIPVKSLTAIQLKPASMTQRGFIQFTIPGGNEVRNRRGAINSVTDAMKDENSVVFKKKHQDEFLALRAVLEEAM